MIEQDLKLEESNLALQKALVGENQARSEVQLLQEEVHRLRAGLSSKKFEEEIAYHKVPAAPRALGFQIRALQILWACTGQAG